jgi:hypothetical protein
MLMCSQLHDGQSETVGRKAESHIMVQRESDLATRMIADCGRVARGVRRSMGP